MAELKSNQSQQKQVTQVPCDVATTESKTSPDNADILLIKNYNKFSNKCVAEGMRNIKEIAELFRVREELRLA